jgi:hypothetical protein
MLTESSSGAGQFRYTEFPPEPEPSAQGETNGAEANPNGQGKIVDDARQVKEPWPEMHAKAFHGLAGDVTKTVKPQTESDPVAILLQLITCFGNVIGRNAHYQIEDTRHYTNLYVCLVGRSARARKGTSEGRVRAAIKQVDPDWEDQRIKSGLSSGEGFINEVRDELKRWNVKEKQFEVIEPAMPDKRLLIIEPEFAQALAVMDRHGNTLSPLIRKAYDGSTLATMTRTSPIRATNAHISMVGHITEAELRARLNRTEALGWTEAELFGLHDPPAHPHPSYCRLSRYDATGLIWHLAGNRVVALAADTAAIEGRTTRNILIYRKHRKPAFGPVGDSLDDFTA